MSAEMKLPVEFFGEFDLHGKPLKAISMVYLDIRERLAQFLLSIDPENFTSEPQVIMENVDTGFGTTERSRVYTHFCSGKLFEQVTAMVRQQHGRRAVAICLTLSFDETTLNTTRSRTGSPLTIFVALEVPVFDQFFWDMAHLRCHTLMRFSMKCSLKEDALQKLIGMPLLT